MGVVVKKKKPLFAKIIRKIKGGSVINEQKYVNPEVSLGDVHINGEDISTIDLMRNELKTMKHGNTDAVVTFDGNNI